MFQLGDTNLVDVKNPLNDLQVLYNGKDLLKENLRLHLYRIQVQNTGNTIILKEYFDDNDLWGVRVSSGSIVKIDKPGSDSTYIRTNLGINTPDKMTLRFTPIIFEPGDFFTFDFFVLSGISTESPHLTSVGKIAGIKQIPVMMSTLEDHRSILYDAYWGNWEVLALRIIAAPVYIILFVAFLSAIIGPVIFVRSRLRRISINNVLNEHGIDLTNPGIVAIKNGINANGLGSIESTIRDIESTIAYAKARAEGTSEQLSRETVEKLIDRRILVRNDKGELELSLAHGRMLVRNDKGELELTSTHGDNIPPDITLGWSMREQEDLIKDGILLEDDGAIKINSLALKALTVLAERFGKKAPNIPASGTLIWRTDSGSRDNASVGNSRPSA